MSEETTKIKKGPGRPRKTPNNSIDILRNGIMEIPHKEGNICEFIYYQPQNLKKILGQCKSVGNSQLFISFMSDRLLFKTKCGVTVATTTKQGEFKTFQIVTFDCKRSNYYYCNKLYEPYEFCVNIDDIFSVLNRYDKENAKIILYLKENDYRSALYMDITTCNPKKTKVAKFNIINGNPEDKDYLNKYIDENYLLTFELSLKEFKKEIAEDAKIISQETKSDKLNVIKLEKIAINPLRIIHCDNDTISLIDNYEDDSIVLENKMSEHEILAISIEINYLKLFCSISTSTGQSEKIIFHLNKEKFIKCTIKLDELIKLDLYNAIIEE